MIDEEAFEIVNALEKAFKEGFELIKYEAGIYGADSYTISNIKELLEYKSA